MTRTVSAGALLPRWRWSEMTSGPRLRYNRSDPRCPGRILAFVRVEVSHGIQ